MFHISVLDGWLKTFVLFSGDSWYLKLPLIYSCRYIALLKDQTLNGCTVKEALQNSGCHSKRSPV